MQNEDYLRINEMMKNKGIFMEPQTNKPYYTGYEYATLYDWDQYFETIIQLYLGWDTHLARSGVEIFLDLQKENGHIQRSSKGCEEQLTEHVKPFLSQILLLIYNRDGELHFLSDNADAYYRRLKKYLLYWLENPQNYHGLAYWDSAPHSGMDNQHERAGYWYDCFCCGVDLNCYLVRECEAFSLIAEILGKKDDAEQFKKRADILKSLICTYMWDETDGFFYDTDRRTGKKIPIRYIGAFAALWAKVADDTMAEKMVSRYLLNDKEFNRGFRYPALSASEAGYSEESLPGDLGCSWRANTWIPTNYYLFEGLRKYGYVQTAAELAEQTFNMIQKIGDREYYATESASGCGLDPFWGWSLLAYFMPYESESGYDPTEISRRENKHILL